MPAVLAPPVAVSRRLAANLLQTQLVRLAHAGAVIERRLGPGLLALSARRLYRRLGFVRLGDYLTERLGIGLRRCQSIVRLERALRELPSVAAAFDAGVLPPSKISIVASAATPQTQDLWLARAQRLTVRELEAAARDASAAPGSAAAPGPPSPDEDPGVLISFAAPARAFALWHWALEFVRRVAGRQEPAWRCAEYLAAEFLSGCPDAEGPEADAAELATSGAHDAGIVATDDETSTPAATRPPPRTALSDEEVWVRAVAAVRDALRPLGADTDMETILSAPSPVAPATDTMRAESSAAPLIAREPDVGDPDPWTLDAHLRDLVRLRQSLAWRQGRLLSAVASFDLYRDLGCDSLGDWCRSVLGMSPRRARYLVSLDRRLDRIPLVADAYRRGLVSWCQARLLVRVARSGTENRWIRFARRVTVRRLEDAITSCAVASADPAQFSQDGAPLPPSDSLPVGRTRPTRHTFAPDDHAATTPVAPSTEALDPARHTFAPQACTHRIAFWAPLDVAAVWRSAVRACRRARGTHLRDWECLLIFIIDMRDAWQPNENTEWRRRYRILDRDGWRCLAPGCTSRSHLNAHHLVFRSHGGTDDDGNLATLCVGHHQAGVHDNRIRCYGRAPDAVWWEFGLRSGGPPLVSYFGDRIVGLRTAAQATAQAAAHASTSPRDRLLGEHAPRERIAAAGASMLRRHATLLPAGLAVCRSES